MWKRAYVLVADNQTEEKVNRVYVITLGILAVGTWWIIRDFTADIKALSDFVTTVSFVSAPIYGWLNYQVMTKADINENEKPQGIFKWYTLVSLALLTLFSVYYLWWRFIA